MIIVLVFAGLLGCSDDIQRSPNANEGKLEVVATTTLVGDVVRAVGGDMVELSVLFSPGVDAHSYEAVPKDIGLVADADIVFINGLGLESSIEKILRSSASHIVSVSEGIVALKGGGNHASEHEGDGEHDIRLDVVSDPHVWFDPRNVMIWVDNIEQELRALDPVHGPTFTDNAGAYRQRLSMLDEWISAQVSTIPPERRLLVADHDTLAYFAQRYGFSLVGSIIPGVSTLSEPSSQSLVALSQRIQSIGVPAIFVGPTTNRDLAQQLVESTGTRLITIDTGSLGPAGTPTGDYIGYMESNVGLIVAGLSG